MLPKSIFNLDRLIVACNCGGASGGRSTGLLSETPILVRYIGPGSASRAYIANDRRYVFGDNRSNKIGVVYEIDVDVLFANNPNLFERVQ